MDIIGVDHVQFAVPDPVATTLALSRYGYELNFCEPAFNVAARSYFRGQDKSMAYLHREASRIELITSAGPVRAACYTPVFGGCTIWSDAPSRDAGGLQTAWDPELCCNRATGTDPSPLLDGVIVHSPHPDRSAAFWQVLGFQLAARDDAGYRLTFPRNFVSMPLDVCLAHATSSRIADPKADDPGCCCIAMISRNLQADRTALEAAGYDTTEATPFRINGRSLTICFISGPGNELVELVEFGRT